MNKISIMMTENGEMISSSLGLALYSIHAMQVNEEKSIRLEFQLDFVLLIQIILLLLAYNLDNKIFKPEYLSS